MILGVVLATQLAAAAPVRHAIVVGANDGGGALEPLRYAEDDAGRFATVLTELGDFDVERVTVLYAPSRKELQDALSRHHELAEAVGEDLFVLYYSGHADARGLRLGDELYAYEELKADFRAVPSDIRIGVLDACRSGTITRLKGASLSAPLFAEEPLAAEGEAWMTAASADEVAQESDTLRGGFFTHYLISGLRGAADSGDGVVDLNEAYLYTHDRVVAHTGGTEAGAQHPYFQYRLDGAGAIGLTDVSQASAVLAIPKDAEGRVTVLRLPDKVPVVEFEKGLGDERRVGVPPGRYLVRRRVGDKLYEVTVGVDTGAMLKVDRWGEVTPEKVATRGEEDGQQKEALLAAGFGIFPGGGQLYHRQPVHAAFYFGTTAALLGGTVLYADRGGDELSMGVGLGLAVWGAGIAVAARDANPGITQRPYTGVTVSTGTGWSSYADRPWATAVTVDVIPRKNVSFGLDRVGLLGHSGMLELNAGARGMYAWEKGRFRYGPFGGVALRAGPYGDPDGFDGLGGVDVVPVTRAHTRLVFSGGVNVRYYVVPRYFLEYEGRVEGDGGVGTMSSVGFGLHFGDPTKLRF